MDSTQDSDAIYLWEDTKVLLAENGLPASLMAMLDSCVATKFENDELHIATNLSFAQRKISQQSQLIEQCLSQAAFQEVRLVVDFEPDRAGVTRTASVAPAAPVAAVPAAAVSPAVAAMQEAPAPRPAAAPTELIQVETTMPASAFAEAAGRPTKREKEVDPREEFIDENLGVADSKLTFDRFVAGEENMMAYDAAKQVANGVGKNLNPLFIYGKSGLGKTHLLRATQNYIVKNDSSRLCVYRTAAEFVEEYRVAWNDSESTARSALTRRYQNVDVLIIDDIQNMMTAAGTIRFFFETFNALVSRGKQIVLAADRSPIELGMGDSKFDERETSRMDSGITVSVQVPDYELKLNLINNFYDLMRQDAVRENVPNLNGTISEENRQLMARESGTNIRVIEGFVHTCLITASANEQAGKPFGREDILRIARAKWPSGQTVVSIERVQKAIEQYFDITHADLVGSKRNKELMEPRHVAIWITRELTENTLADIGKKFGGRSHATVKHSIAWVEKNKKEDRIFQDRLQSLMDSILEKD